MTVNGKVAAMRIEKLKMTPKQPHRKGYLHSTLSVSSSKLLCIRTPFYWNTKEKNP